MKDVFRNEVKVIYEFIEQNNLFIGLGRVG